jgi:hypothetical protein
MANASSRFWWNDYAADPGLRACSLSAQGFWMRLLCLAAEAQPPGYVLINGRAPSAEELARICGTSTQVAGKLLGELERNGVSSRTEAGVIYNRRMVRDAGVSGKRAEAGTKGARATWGGGDDPILPWQNDGKSDGKGDSKPDGKPETFAMPVAMPPEDSGSGSDSGVQSPESIKNSELLRSPREERAGGTRPAEAPAEAPRMRSMRSAGGPDWSLPEVRHQAWVTAALATVRRALPQDQATALIARFLDNDPSAKEEIERLVHREKQQRGAS